MTSPKDVVAFHAEYDKHPDDRIRLFQSITDLLPRSASVLYPGSYVDIAPSVWFDNVTYVDVDKRADRFFAESNALADLIEGKRRSADGPTSTASTTFHRLDYCEPLPIEHRSVDLLISLYAGFISEHCSDYLVDGGLLLANNSHGDASMASLDPRCRLAGVIESRGGRYVAKADDLSRYLQPKRKPPTVDSLHESNRGIAYTRSPFAYLFHFSKLSL